MNVHIGIFRQATCLSFGWMRTLFYLGGLPSLIKNDKGFGHSRCAYIALSRTRSQ